MRIKFIIWWFSKTLKYFPNCYAVMVFDALRRQEASNFCHLMEMFIMGYWFSIWCCSGRLGMRETRRWFSVMCMTSIRDEYFFYAAKIDLALFGFKLDWNFYVIDGNLWSFCWNIWQNIQRIYRFMVREVGFFDGFWIFVEEWRII